MKLIRFGSRGNEKPGIQLDNEQRLDVTSFGEDYTESFFGNNGISRLKKWLENNQSGCPIIDSDDICH